MAVPTITSVIPAVIFTGGQMIVVEGTDFQLPYPPPLDVNGVLPTPPPTMTVTVGGRQCRNVRVLSATQVECLTKPVDPGALAVVVRNLDAAGAIVPGESASASGLLTARRAELWQAADLLRLEMALILELRRQVIASTHKTTAVDYDDTPNAVLDIPDIAELPTLTIQGPQIVEDRDYIYDLTPTAVVGTAFSRRRTPKALNLTYRFVAMDNKQVRNMNLMALMFQFLQNNPFIELLRQEDDLSKGTVRYELAQVGEVTTFTGSSSSDIRGFSGSLVIRGFQVEDVVGFVDQTVAERGSTVDNVSVELQDLLPP
jgi:hypothetical protein